MSIRVGNHVVHREQPAWGIGRVVGVSKDGSRYAVRFSGRPREELQVSARDPGVQRYRYVAGDEVRVRVDADKVAAATVTGNVSGDLDRLTLDVQGEARECTENDVAAQPPSPKALEGIVQGRWGDAKNYRLRQGTLRLDVERRSDGLGALFSSRVMVKPYQVAVAHRVLSDRTPRFVLADEVGLGKTIEAGMILNALLHARLGKRVLVVAPSHLAVQWLTELLHKFNLRFTLLDADRIDALQKEAPDEDPWGAFDLVVTSLELLLRSKKAREGACDADNRWDLVVIDEAHHLRGDRSFEVAADLSLNAWGLLLLTATPMKLDPAEYYRLLRLVESAPVQDVDEFVRRIERQAELSKLVKALEEAGPKEAATQAKKVAALFPADETLARLAAAAQKSLTARDQLLEHLADVYSLSARLIRNRRAVVGGFTERRLAIVDVTLDAEQAALHREVQDAVHDAAKKGTLPAGAPLALLLRRLDSSPMALAKALEARNEPALKSLAKRALATAGLAKDAKLRALRDRLKEVHRADPKAKVLVFTESRETLEYLIAELTKDGIQPLHYHGELETIERDRMVARFRDPEGPRVLVSTEAGGEGRNFQFCHVLVHYDLPWSPSAIEQRIGRLDRVGQTKPVEIVVLRPHGTQLARVIDLMAEDVQVFTATIGGLDAVLEEVEGELVQLAASGGEKAWQDFGRKLGKAVSAARKAIQDDYDPLLDRRSFDRERVTALLDRAHKRAGLAEEDEELELDSLEEGLDTVSRDLDERLEETVLGIARKVGITVDTDDNVDAFTCRLTFGGSMVAEAIPGLETDEERVVEGTFWRDTAVEREELEFLATGHPIVEALVNWVRDGEFGRTSVMKVREGDAHALGATFAYTIVLPEAEDLARGAHVPSRQAERLLDGTLLRVAVDSAADGSIAERSELLEIAEESSRVQTLRPTELPLSAAKWEPVVRAMEQKARALATARMKKAVLEGEERLVRETGRRIERLTREVARAEGDERTLRTMEMLHEKQFAEAVRSALKASRLVLDSMAVVVVEPAPAVGKPTKRRPISDDD